eukprot:XP_019922314.1 PREDICTED: solute carrier family 13 member 5 isoform X2 [Crassostrea gigas]
MQNVRTKVWNIVKDIWSLKPVLLPVLVTLLPLPMVTNSESKATRCGYTVIVMAVLWLTEALPIPVTSLVPIFMLPMLGVSTAKEVSSSYVTDTSMLFLGGLIVAVAVEEWNLHRRIALAILRLVGAQPNLLMLGLMLPTWFLSMWISNTAAAAMMIPIVGAVTSHVKSVVIEGGMEDPDDLCLLATNDKDVHVEMQKGEKVVLTSVSKKSNEKENSNDVNSTSQNAQYNRSPSRSSASPDALRMHSKLSKALALSIAYAANTGGIATLTGTPPNLVFKAVTDEAYAQAGKLYDGQEWDSGVNFTSWLLFALPISFLTLILGWLWLQMFFLRCKQPCDCFRKIKSDRDKGVREIIAKEFKALGRITFAECLISFLFISLAFLWIFRDPPNIKGWGDFFPGRYVSDSTPVMLIAVLLFVLPAKIPAIFCARKTDGDRYTPLLTWEKTAEKVPWGVIVLLGGGFALAQASGRSGLSKWFGDSLEFFASYNPFVMCLVVSLVVASVTEVTSNTATATLLMPILQELSIAAGMNPIYLMMAAAVACSFAFMLPVATPPSAIVFAHGYLSIPDMASAGLAMNVIAVFILTVGINTWGNLLFNFATIPVIFQEILKNQTLIGPVIEPIESMFNVSKPLV